MKNFDIYEAVTARIIEQLEKGLIPWRKPWKVSGVKFNGVESLKNVAFNRITKTAYSPLNQMLLSRAGEYATYKQWHELGGTIKAGAKAEMVTFWKIQENITTEETDDGERIEKRVAVPILKYYNVFHIDDVNGVKPLTAEQLPQEPKFDSDQTAEDIIKEYQRKESINIRFGGDRAFYSIFGDYIQTPAKEQFKQRAEFYSTIFHEITHSTGAKHRLDRLEPAFFGDEKYSKEELVAEIGSAGMLSILNIETTSSFKNSTAYIQSWLEKLRNDKRLIVSASAKAEKAVKYILNGIGA